MDNLREPAGGEPTRPRRRASNVRGACDQRVGRPVVMHSEKRELEREIVDLSAILRDRPGPLDGPEFDRFWQACVKLGQIMLVRHLAALGAARVRDLVVDWLSEHYRDAVHADNPAALMQWALPRRALTWLRSPRAALGPAGPGGDEKEEQEVADPNGGEDELHERMFAFRQLERLVACAAALPPDEYAAFLACAVRGDAPADVAASAGVGVPVVYKRISRARQRIKEAMREPFE